MSLRSRSLNFQHFNVSFPQDRIVQVTLNRPEKLNCINKATSQEIKEIWELFDEDESLWVGIITGTERAFCTGADLQGRFLTFYSIPKISLRRQLINADQNRMERDEQGRDSQ